MRSHRARDFIYQAFGIAGISVNGPNPYDIRVNDERMFGRVLADGTLGFGESYMDGWWDSDRLDETISRILAADIDSHVKNNLKALPLVISAKIRNQQTKLNSVRNARHHYDIGNTLYSCMLDTHMVYSCGYWKNAENLIDAQEAKLDLCCKKMNLRPGMTVLDIGCGWGSFAHYAAKKYGVYVTGITLARRQERFAEKRCLGLPVRIMLKDYRDITGMYDRIVSIGMFEHVGLKNYRTFMKTVHQHLRDDGLMLLHTIGSNGSGGMSEPWINRYIFPGGQLPSVAEIGQAAEGLFVMEDWHSFGPDYDKTLLQWYRNFCENWPKLCSRYDERFFRMWTYYLLSCAGAFRARKNQLWQIVFSKRGVQGGYESFR